MTADNPSPSVSLSLGSRKMTPTAQICVYTADLRHVWGSS